MKSRTLSALLACFLLIAILQGCYAYPIHEAETPADIRLFQERHIQDTSALFFHNHRNVEEKGFFASIFDLFGSSSDSDDTILNEIAENIPVIKIDVGQDALQDTAEDYDVSTVPYVVAYHKGVEILREVPNSSTADSIEEKVKDLEQERLHKINHASTVHPERAASEVDINDEKKDTDVHHHPKPLEVVPGDISGKSQSSAVEPSESDLVSARPVQALDKKSQTAPATDTNKVVQFKKNAAPTKPDPSATRRQVAQPVRQQVSGKQSLPAQGGSTGARTTTTQGGSAATRASTQPTRRTVANNLRQTRRRR